jgi:hypothetical protein
MTIHERAWSRPCRSKDAQCLAREFGVLLRELCPVRVGHGAYAGVTKDVRAASKQHFRSAVHECALTPVGEQTHDRVALAVGVERDLVVLRHVAFEFVPAALCPAERSAPSVGSPMTFQVPFISSRCALLQPMRISAICRKGVAWRSSVALPSKRVSPSGPYPSPVTS